MAAPPTNSGRLGGNQFVGFTGTPHKPNHEKTCRIRYRLYATYIPNRCNLRQRQSRDRETRTFIFQPTMQLNLISLCRCVGGTDAWPTRIFKLSILGMCSCRCSVGAEVPWIFSWPPKSTNIGETGWIFNSYVFGVFFWTQLEWEPRQCTRNTSIFLLSGVEMVTCVQELTVEARLDYPGQVSQHIFGTEFVNSRCGGKCETWCTRW